MAIRKAGYNAVSELQSRDLRRSSFGEILKILPHGTYLVCQESKDGRFYEGIGVGATYRGAKENLEKSLRIDGIALDINRIVRRRIAE